GGAREAIAGPVVGVAGVGAGLLSGGLDGPQDQLLLDLGGLAEQLGVGAFGEAGPQLVQQVGEFGVGLHAALLWATVGKEEGGQRVRLVLALGDRLGPASWGSTGPGVALLGLPGCQVAQG